MAARRHADQPTTPGLDRDISRFVNSLLEGSARYPDLALRTLPEQRAISEELRRPWRAGGPAMARKEDVWISFEDTKLRVRLFDADPPGPIKPVIVYMHGGGFTSFSLDTHDRVMREYAARSKALVAGVDYSLSPEAKFPIALHQSVAAIRWLAREGRSFGVDPERIAVGGDSAGANLAMAASLFLRDCGEGDLVKALILNFGFFDADFETESQRRYGGPGNLLTTSELEQFLENYLGGTPHAANPLALPILADLRRLPPSFHVIAECDALKDGDLEMVAKLRAAGNGVKHVVYKGASHGFIEAVSISAIAQQAFVDTAQWLKQTFDALGSDG